MPAERMLVLASSRKPGGRCIAGLSLSDYTLVRPVSRGSGAIDLDDCGLDTYPQEFDVVTFHHEGHDGDVTQPENLLVDGTAWGVEVPMEPARAVPLLDPLLQPGEVLFGNRGKAVPHHVAAEGMEESLCLVEPSLLGFELTIEGKPRAMFECGAAQWDLQLTDHRVRPQLLRQRPGHYDLDDLGFGQPTRVFLLLSLATPHNEWHTKLAAAVLDVS
jgi:hypothetical protein